MIWYFNRRRYIYKISNENIFTCVVQMAFQQYGRANEDFRNKTALLKFFCQIDDKTIREQPFYFKRRSMEVTFTLKYCRFWLLFWRVWAHTLIFFSIQCYLNPVILSNFLFSANLSWPFYKKNVHPTLFLRIHDT